MALLDGNTLKAEAAMKTANGILPVSTPMKK
ncbi:hypothetical protein ABIE12_000661 [Serratia sp. 509]